MYDITVFVLSDSVGETGTKLARACLAQFPNCNYEIKRYPYILSKDQILEAIDEARDIPSVIIYSTVMTDHQDFIENQAKKLGIPTIDIMKKPLTAISNILHDNPIRESGILRRMDEKYFQTVNAVEFAVKYDDGKDPRGVLKADICLVGISRTSKTPLSMYLANKGYYVANVPLVPEVPLARELYEKDKRRVFGLETNVESMMKIRAERLLALGLPANSMYSETDRIEKEIEYSKKVMDELGCTVIDVSNKAIEETAEIILETMEARFGIRD
ncbi:pyruvate, water dikinase regulatory protein [Ezakiella peruensis]|uniref:pyruvate, water dikinase regulatory protein n=1 Tax=Ezakiella peruensis TaxID=1464038 RepID=UPI000C1B00B4|nr:pyruvate, water dikinase regulatory protein [Ezakiella peruensis]